MNDNQKKFLQDIVNQKCNLYQVPGCPSTVQAPVNLLTSAVLLLDTHSVILV